MPGTASRMAAVTLATATDEHGPIYQRIWIVPEEAMEQLAVALTEAYGASIEGVSDEMESQGRARVVFYEES